MDALVTRTLQPVVEALAATGEINSKLILSNTGYLINWYLGEMRALLGDERLAALRQHCFFEKQLADGRDNPLWRTVMLRERAVSPTHLLSALSPAGCPTVRRLYA